jgi:hypothetical protein
MLPHLQLGAAAATAWSLKPCAVNCARPAVSWQVVDAAERCVFGDEFVILQAQPYFSARTSVLVWTVLLQSWFALAGQTLVSIPVL